jgi:soluble lytic murein transglycosylase-like protein
MINALAAAIRPVAMACILHAAAIQHVPGVLLLGLLKTEGGLVGSWTTNTDGSNDLGPMQINDRTWAQKIADMQFGGDREKATRYLIYDGCYNVEVGAYIFGLYLQEASGNYGVAVGYYNSHSPLQADVYRRRFLQSLNSLLAENGQ